MIENKPFIHLFRTQNDYYLYDVNMDQIISISKHTYEYLECQQINGNTKRFVERDEAICKLKDKGFLKSQRVERIKHPETDILKYYIDNKIQHMVLQVTQRCNLRCEYCVYSGEYENREHGNKQMQFEVAQAALDYYIAHSRDTLQLSVGFYGGEPCLNLELIMRCVEYMKEAAEGRCVNYSITTNATLLDKKTIQFFAENNFNILISLDGPKEIHDKHRRFAFSGEGSFDIVLKNVKYMKENFPEYCKKNVSFNMVIDTENEFSKVNNFLISNAIVADFNIRGSIIDFKHTDKAYAVSADYMECINYERFKLFLQMLGEIPKNNVSKLVSGYENVLRDTLSENYSSFSSCLPKESQHSLH